MQLFRALLLVLAAQEEEKAEPAAVHTLAGHADAVRALEFSPDGCRILTGSRDTTAAIWDARTGARVHVLSGHDGGVTTVAFSPDGRRALTGSQDRTLALWDAGSGERLKVLKGHEGWVRRAAFTPDGKRAISAGLDRKMLTWNLETGKSEAAFEAHAVRILSCAWTTDRRKVLVGSDDNTLGLWDVDKGERTVLFAGYQGWARFSALSPDAALALTGSWDDSFWVWDAAGGKVLHRSPDHRAWVMSGAFRQDGRGYATGDRDGKIHLRDLEGHPQVRALLASSGAVHDLAFSPGGRFLAAGYETGTAVVWHPRGRSNEDDAWVATWRGKGEAERRRDLDSLVADALRGSLAKGARAQERLVRAGAEAVAALLAAAPPDALVPVAGEERRAQLLKELDSEEYAVRVKAHKEILGQGQAILPWVEKQLARPLNDHSVEVRSSLEDLKIQLRERQGAGPDRPRLGAVLLLAEMERDPAVQDALKRFAAQPAGRPSTERARQLLGR